MNADIKLSLIQCDDPDLQMREGGIDVGVVAEYTEAMSDGAVFPPVLLFFDDDAYWPADGFHRIAAAKKISRDSITAEIRKGSKRDAVLHAVGVNASHGLRRTSADKRRSLVAMLRDPEWTKWSDREIGKRCAVDGKTVARVRAELTADFRTERSFTNKHGSISTVKVAVPSADGAQGSMVARMLAKAGTDALIAECHRRGLKVVSDAH